MWFGKRRRFLKSAFSGFMDKGPTHEKEWFSCRAPFCAAVFHDWPLTGSQWKGQAQCPECGTLTGLRTKPPKEKPSFFRRLLACLSFAGLRKKKLGTPGRCIKCGKPTVETRNITGHENEHLQKVDDEYIRVGDRRMWTEPGSVRATFLERPFIVTKIQDHFAIIIYEPFRCGPVAYSNVRTKMSMISMAKYSTLISRGNELPTCR